MRARHDPARQRQGGHNNGTDDGKRQQKAKRLGHSVCVVLMLIEVLHLRNLRNASQFSRQGPAPQSNEYPAK